MKIKGLIDTDFVNYKKTALYVAFPRCSFKCDRECGMEVCQNSLTARDPDIEIPIEQIYQRYIDNPITEAFVFCGLEPFDSWDDLYELVSYIRQYCKDDIVIYTGYNENEITEYIEKLQPFGHIIVKFGRYRPYENRHRDEVLGVWLASDNQYAKEL